MTKFIVTLEVEVEGDSPLDAARKVRRYVLDYPWEATNVLRVQIADDPDLADWTINLDEPDEKEQDA